ncbi:hypothetical protein RHS01_04028 [Rhizoctonia solani]|uniref:Brain protein I3 n=1 Tax=Rhizoctonia solani TaxID=456999 RepID=A0A8H7IEX7_9AGAM|nr:hypothetical protein RHS01_04028 [Rhizoctonia solani]
MTRPEPVKKVYRAKAQPKVNHTGKLTFVTAAQSRADKEAWLREHQTGYKRMERTCVYCKNVFGDKIVRVRHERLCIRKPRYESPDTSMDSENNSPEPPERTATRLQTYRLGLGSHEMVRERIYHVYSYPAPSDDLRADAALCCSTSPLFTHTMVNFVARKDNPPTYDVAVGSSTGSTAPPPPASPTLKSKDTPYPQPPLQPQPHNGMFIAPALGPGPAVYRYHNPRTGEVVSSLLPPDHPEMVCLQQGHIIQTQYGVLGIAAVFWFPLGIALCLLDKRTKCERCGLVIDDGCF